MFFLKALYVLFLFIYVILTHEVTITIQIRVKMYCLASDIETFVDLTHVVTLVTCVVTDTCVNRLHCLATNFKMYCKVHRVYERKNP